MCIFTRPVNMVASTQIFARACGEGRQVLAYGMVLDAATDLAMILPLPVAPGAGEADVKFIDLSRYADFFEDLEKNVVLGRGTRSAGLGKTVSLSMPKLKVQNVGSFEASFAPTRPDLDRLDERFRLDPSVWQNLDMYKDFGFAVFKLKPGRKHIHPMAFEFPRRDANALFFPTVHIHDGHHVPDRAKFDHELFFQWPRDPRIDYRRWLTSVAPARDFMRKDALPPGLMDLDLPCHSIPLQEERANRDIHLVEGPDGRVDRLG